MKYGYARVSTTDQNASLQQDALRAAGCEKIITEKVSGTSTKRPKLDKLLSNLEAGDTLIVWRLDRLGRNIDHLRKTILWCGEQDIGFKSLHETIDTTSANGRLIFNVFSAVINFERDLLAERTKAGLEAAKKRGVKLGRRPALSPQQIKHAWQLVANGEPMRTVAETMGVDRSTLFRALKKLDKNV